MKISIAVFVIGFSFGWILYKWIRQKKALKSLKAENADLRKNLKMYLTDTKVPLTQSERIMIRVALAHPGFKGWIEEPKTKAVYRIIYRDLKLKIKRSIQP